MRDETNILGDRAEPQVAYDGQGGELPLHKKKLYADLRRKKILDVGCGTGTAARFLSGNGNSVSGVTASEEEARVARKSMAEVQVLDLDTVREFQFEHHDFDVILFGDVLEHLKYPHSLLVLSKSILTSDGLIYVSLPNVANLKVRIGLMLGSFRYEESGILDKTHLRFFTIDSARQLLANARFEIIEEHYSNWNWSILPGRLSRLLRLTRMELMVKDGLTACFPGLLATQVMFVARPMAIR